MNRFCYRPINTFTGSLVCLLVLLFVTVLSPERMNAQSPRLEVSEDLSESRDMQGCFLAAANAARLEDLDGFLIHFTADAQKKLRRRTAMLFVQHEFTLVQIQKEHSPSNIEPVLWVNQWMLLRY